MSQIAASQNNSSCNCVCHTTINSGQCRCNCYFETFKLYDDEKIEKLEKKIYSLEKWKQTAIEKNIQDINRIRELEKINNELIGEIKEIKRTKAQVDLVAHHYMEQHEITEKLNKRIKELELLTNAVKGSHNNICAPSLRKEPYKCPVCDASGKRDLGYGCTIECSPCEGKGIIWR